MSTFIGKNNDPINTLNSDINYKFKTFGILSAVFLAIHSIFLGIKFDIQIYKLFRRVVLLFFIIFEIVAQGYLVFHFFKLKVKIKNLILKKVLFLKLGLVSILATVAILSLPLLVTKGNTQFKHALEWNYFCRSYIILFIIENVLKEPHKFLGFRPEI